MYLLQAHLKIYIDVSDKYSFILKKNKSLFNFSKAGNANFLFAGGVTQPFCPYKCLSEKYKMPKCYTPLEELIYTFGGPWPFAIILSFVLVLLALLLSALRIKMVGSDFSYRSASSIQHDGSDSLPYLLSLAEVFL